MTTIEDMYYLKGLMKTCTTHYDLKVVEVFEPIIDDFIKCINENKKLKILLEQEKNNIKEKTIIKYVKK